MTNELQVIANQSGLAQNKIETLLSSFGVYFQQSKAIAETSKNIIVTSEDQKEEMQKARKARLELWKIRCNVENTRKELKEQSLREGKAIDGISNVIKALIIPVEEHLEKQEKFAEIMEAKRKAERLAKRQEELSKVVDDISLYNLSDMSDEAFNSLVKSSQEALEAKKEAEKRAEQERIAREKKEAEEREKMRLENEKLRKEAEKREAKLAQERKKAIEARKKQDELLRKEREAREKAEAEIRAKKEAEEKAKKEAEEKARNEELARLKAEKEARLAPDKEKMRVIYKAINGLTDFIHEQTFTTEEARKVAGQTITELQTTMSNMAERMKKL